MSMSASFGFRVVRSMGKELVSQTDIVRMLASHGWSFLRNGYACYLPIGDNDDFAWAGEMISFTSLLKILEEKEQRSELIGVAMTWQDTGIDGELLLWSESESKKEQIHTPISFNMAANRKQSSFQENFNITDVNWYLERFLPAFNKGNSYVEYFTYNEYR